MLIQVYPMMFANTLRQSVKFGIVAIFVLGCGGTHKNSSDARGANAAERKCISEANSPPKDLKNSPARVWISHVVVRHKSLSKTEGTVRTRGQACLRALEARDELRDGTEWADVVQHFSDMHEPNEGDLGKIRKGERDKNFERAAFSLDVRELSYVVETDDGFEILLRTQ